MNFGGAAASVLGRQAMRALDAATIAAGTPSLELMERAAEAIAAALEDTRFHGVELPERPRLLVLAGRGNNGGDGVAVARLLAGRRWRCTVVLVAGEPPAGDAATNLAVWRRIAGPVAAVAPGDASAIAAALADDYDLVLDAMLGTGLDRPVDAGMAAWIDALDASRLPVVAADIPSGLCSDTGLALGRAVKARATVAIGAAKPGLLDGRGPSHSGRVRVADIGLLDPAAAGIASEGLVLDEATTAGAWPRLDPMAHKGTRGHVVVVAGSRGKAGAAVLAARAALRAGAGLVTVACAAEVAAVVTATLPEAMTAVLEADGAGGLDPGAAALLASVLARANTAVAGPGLGTSAGAEAAVEAVLGADLPVVLDADALNVVASWPDERRRRTLGARRQATVLTPHPAEAARLARTSTEEIQSRRALAAEDLSRQLNSVVVLKGAATVVASAGRLAFNLAGNPGMGAAGMGDVLAGAAGAVVARLADPFAAACLAAWAHGRAGDLAGPPGFLAREVADLLPAVLATRLPR